MQITKSISKNSHEGVLLMSAQKKMTDKQKLQEIRFALLTHIGDRHSLEDRIRQILDSK